MKNGKSKVENAGWWWRSAYAALLVLHAAFCVLHVSAATSITVDSVTQRWPWNNKVDITYTVEGGQYIATSNFCKIVFTTLVDGNSYAFDGSSVGASANAGTHKVTWTLPPGIKSANCKMTAAAYPSAVPSGNDYMIIDLATGAIEYEGLYATQEESNRRYNTALYKTDKLVLRKVPAGGTYHTGDTDHFPSTLTGTAATKKNVWKKWTTDRDYYIGVFPVTQSQYKKVYGSNPSGKVKQIAGNIAEHRPVECVSWFRLRCSPTDTQVYYASTSPVPAVAEANTGTFFQRLNYKTGKYFDLPTEVMFEIAARGGTHDYYYWGNTTNSVLDYVICAESGNNIDSTGATNTVAVGSRLPNNWGLYDVVGNVYQMCLDDRVDNSPSLNKDAFTPACATSPTAANSKNRRIRSGWCYNSSVTTSTGEGGYMSYRGNINLDTGTTTAGFRVAHIVE